MSGWQNHSIASSTSGRRPFATRASTVGFRRLSLSSTARCTLRLGMILSLMLMGGCTADRYRFQDTFTGLNRKELTPESLVRALGEPARVSRASGDAKEGAPADAAYRYYFATRDGHPGAKIFYFHRGRWTGENVLGGQRHEAWFRLLDPSESADKRLIEQWEAENPHIW